MSTPDAARVQKVLLAEPRGFCAGVEMAIKALAWMVRAFEPPVYCYHEIVHNRLVVERFRNLGVVFVDSIADVPDGAPVMLSAHGSAPEVAVNSDAKFPHASFYFRRVEELRNIMVLNGDSAKQVWLLEFGWTTDKVNPQYTQTFVFDNDHPGFSLEAPADLAPATGIYQNLPARGVARVVCYSPKHNLTLAELEPKGIESLLSVWQEQYRDLGSRPEIAHGHAGNLTQRRPKAGGQGDVTKTHRLWQHKGKVPQSIGSPVILGDRCYFVDEPGTARCIDIKTGNDVGEKEKIAKTWSSVVHGDGKLYLATYDDGVFVLEASPKFTQLAHNLLGDEKMRATVSVADGVFYIRTFQHLWCIGAKP